MTNLHLNAAERHDPFDFSSLADTHATGRASVLNLSSMLKCEAAEPTYPYQPTDLADVASECDAAVARELDQFYTLPEVAASCYAVFREHFDPNDFQIVEPSAGQGAFSNILPCSRIALDLVPKAPGVLEADFLKYDIRRQAKKVAFLGNPPFGTCSRKAIAFFNRAALTATVIAFIVPRTFKKERILDKLNQSFFLLREVELPPNSFTFLSKPRDVPTVFQIWVRLANTRELISNPTRHPDFEFTTRNLADFAIQRIGAQAGRVHHDFDRSKQSTYFIRGPVEHIMRKLDLAGAARNTAGKPSLAKTEIVALYRAYVGR